MLDAKITPIRTLKMPITVCSGNCTQVYFSLYYDVIPMLNGPCDSRLKGKRLSRSNALMSSGMSIYGQKVGARISSKKLGESKANIYRRKRFIRVFLSEKQCKNFVNVKGTSSKKNYKLKFSFEIILLSTMKRAP